MSLLKQTHVHWMTLGRYKQNTNKWLANSFSQSELESAMVEEALTMHPVNDVKFWMQQEVTIAPILLQHTHKVFCNGE